MADENGQFAEGMKVILLDDDPSIREIAVETLEFIDDVLSVEGVPTFDVLLQRLKTGEKVSLLVLDNSEIKGRWEDLLQVLLADPDMAKMVLSVFTGSDYHVLRRTLEGVCDRLPSEFLMMFMGKPTPLKTWRDLVALTASFVSDSGPVKLEGANGLRFVGSGLKAFVDWDVVETFDLQDVESLANLIGEEDVVSISIDVDSQKDLFNRVSEVFMADFDRVFESPCDFEEVRSFVCKILDRKVAMVLGKVLDARKGGSDVWAGIVHDLRNILGADISEVNFVAFARERLQALRDGFEAGKFIGKVSVADFFSADHFSFDEGRFHCNVEESDLVELPVGGLGFIVGNLVRNFNKVVEGDFWKGDDVESFKSSWIDVQVEKEGDTIVIRVSDNAPLIPSACMPNLFDRPLSEGEKRQRGSGRSLYDMANMLKRFGGDITLHQCFTSVGGCVKKSPGGIKMLEPSFVSLPEGATKQFEIRLPLVVY